MPVTPIDFAPEPDLHPLYPTVTQISQQVSLDSGLDPSQKAELVSHCLTRACVFGDIAVVQYLLTDSQAQTYVDLSLHDNDQVNLVSLTIHGFGVDLDRDIEREECVRLLVSQGADMSADKAGWTPLHYAAILSPPTLVSYLMTHGCSPFAVTGRNLTPLDIVTAHSILPGKEDVALLLEESMREKGWTGGRVEERRRLLEQKMKKKGKRKEIREDVGKVLGINPEWWQKRGSELDNDDSGSDSDEDEDVDEGVYTPRADYSSMLVFSPSLLSQIFESVITNFRPTFKDATPANTLYMLARFAALTCDHTWLEDLIIGATDAIEDTFFNRADDLPCLVFWLYNTTLWLHLLECDTSINEACEMLGSFEIIEEVINSVFVFIIRFAERKIDQLLDGAILSYTPMASEFDAIQFESEWTFLRPFASRRKAPPPLRNPIPASPSSPFRPSSPSQSHPKVSSSASRGFSSLRQSINRVRGHPSLSTLFQESSGQPSPFNLTSFLTSLHLLLVLSNVNPAIITQLWSQVLYWTSCEIFNRVLTRKKYLCRSRAIQISMNLTAIDEWVEEMGIPSGVQNHLAPAKDLLNWLQCFSSITEFHNLVATIQTLKHINPLQMRRAIRDYKYEVNEGRMTEECIQYLTQLQKDWERHRVKLGVEALRKEMVERERERDGSISSMLNDAASGIDQAPSIAPSVEPVSPQQNIDILFEKNSDISTWEPGRPPQVLGELLDSRHMLPLLFPSDPRLLAALPSKKTVLDDTRRVSIQSLTSNADKGSSGRTSASGTPLPWISRNRTVRQVDIVTLQWVDGVHSAARWGREIPHEFDVEDDENLDRDPQVGLEEDGSSVNLGSHITPYTRKPSVRTKGRTSFGDSTPVDGTFEIDVSP